MQCCRLRRLGSPHITWRAPLWAGQQGGWGKRERYAASTTAREAEGIARLRSLLKGRCSAARVLRAAARASPLQTIDGQHSTAGGYSLVSLCASTGDSSPQRSAVRQESDPVERQLALPPRQISRRGRSGRATGCRSQHVHLQPRYCSTPPSSYTYPPRAVRHRTWQHASLSATRAVATAAPHGTARAWPIAAAAVFGPGPVSRPSPRRPLAPAPQRSAIASTSSLPSSALLLARHRRHP